MNKCCNCKFNSRIAYLQNESNEICDAILICDYDRKQLITRKLKIVCDKHNDLQLCCGPFKNKYFRHANTNLDRNDMRSGSWFSDWQNLFEPDTEVKVGNMVADVLIGSKKRIIEFQYGNIDQQTIIDKSSNCRQNGYEIIWVINFDGVIIPAGRRFVIEIKNDDKIKYFIGTKLPYIYLSYNDCVYRLDLTNQNSNNTIYFADSYMTDKQFVYYVRNDSEWNPKSNIIGTIYYNQRGAGCGKTYESIQLLNCKVFPKKHVYIYLTKVHSAKQVIKCELEDQYNNRSIRLRALTKNSGSDLKQYKYNYRHPVTKGEVTVLIGTIDSFCYALCKKKPEGTYSDYFAEIVDNINRGHIVGNNITYAREKILMSSDCLVIIDECQDLDINYINAMDNIVRKSGIDVYVIGDYLQSIYKVPNTFTHLASNHNNVDSFYSNIISNTGTNKVRRFHNSQFINFVNKIVKFSDYNLPAVTSICDGCDKYARSHKNKADAINVIQLSYKNKSNSDLSDTKSPQNKCIAKIISYIKDKMTLLIDSHNYKPHNFMFIFPILKQNYVVERLSTELEFFWQEKMRKKNIDTDHYVHVHMSEEGKPIDLDISAKSTRILSIHASKGNGCEVVFVCGLSESSLSVFLSSRDNYDRFESKNYNLKYESLLHVALTRQKEHIFIILDKCSDNITRRFSDYLSSDDKCYYNTRIISKYTQLKAVVNYVHVKIDSEKNIHFKNIADSLELNLYESKQNDLVDWNDHVIRNIIFKVMFFENMIVHSGTKSSQYFKLIYDFKKAEIITYEKVSEYYKVIDAEEINVIPILKFKKENYKMYEKILKKYIEHIQKKIKKKRILEDACSIEIIIYYYCLNILACHNRDKNFNINRLYHILSNFNKSNIDETDHSRNCLCKKYFNVVVTPKISSGKYVNHYEKLSMIDDIVNNYTLAISKIIDKPINYYMFHSSRYEKNNWVINCRPYILGLCDSHCVNIYFETQLNQINYGAILTNVILSNFIISQCKKQDKQGTHKFLGKKIITVIITLDSSEPIVCKEYLLTDDQQAFIISTIKSYYMSLSDRYHCMIRNLCKYYYEINLRGLFEHVDADVNKKLLPDYIDSFFNVYKKMYETNNTIKIKEFAALLDNEKKFCKKNKEKLENEINNFLGIVADNELY
jgi:hypothetical protein